MKATGLLIKRNVKLFFKDRGMFFTSLVTPMILLVLYATFLGNVYRDSFRASLPPAFSLSEGIVDGLVASQLISSLLAVSCVTVAFSANFVMVQDKAGGAAWDLRMAPVRPAVLSLGYYVATLLATLLICFAATAICLVYVALVGWYLSAADVLLLFFDVFLLTLFGTALSSLINLFLSTQGQISAASAIVSAGYGFICGAYMPISSFGEGLQRVVLFLPGTYGTSLIRNHAMGGVLEQMQEEGVPDAVLDGIKASLDCKLTFFDTPVSMGAMYGILAGAILLLIGGYLAIHSLRRHTRKR